MQISSPSAVAALPAVNPLMLNHLIFDVSIAGLADAPLSAPVDLVVGSASGNVTYTLDRGGPAMIGSGTFDGKPVTETWSFGPQWKVDGKLGDTEEHLAIAFNQDVWHVSGTVGGIAVDEALTFSQDGDHIATTGTIGGQAVQENVAVSRPGEDGLWGATLDGTLQGAPCKATATFHTLQDRIALDVTGQSGDVAWSAHGAGIFGPSGDPQPAAQRKASSAAPTLG